MLLYYIIKLYYVIILYYTILLYYITMIHLDNSHHDNYYCRQLAFRTGVNITTEELKSSTAGQTVEAFLNVSTNTTSDGR